MKQKINKKNGQAILEYVGLIVMVSLALFVFSMRNYFQRSIQARWKGNADSISDIQYSSDSSYNVSQYDWDMDVRTAGGVGFQEEYDPVLNCTVWHL